MAIITYTIISGSSPFTVELTPSLIPPIINIEPGTYSINDVPNGTYNLIISDSNECVFQTEITVDPFVTTTTTTVLQGDSIIMGQTNDQNLIFNINGTNRDSHYIGYPDENNSTIYLWLKTLNGLPITSQKIINYNITTSGNSLFSFVTLSDQIHAEVVETIAGSSSTISGQLILKIGFIETYFQYTYLKNQLTPDFEIELNSINDWLYTNIPLTGGTKQYGVTYIDRDNMIMKF